MIKLKLDRDDYINNNRIDLASTAIVTGNNVTRLEAQENLSIINSCIDLVSRNGTGKIHFSSQTDSSPRSVLPVEWAPSTSHDGIRIKNGVTLTGEGMYAPGAKLHKDALDGTQMTKFTNISFTDDCFFGGIKDLQVDGNIENQDFLLFSGPGQWIDGSHTAQSSVHGILWSNSPDSAKISLENVWSHDTLKSCFVGNGATITGHNLLGGNSATDHIFYITDIGAFDLIGPPTTNISILDNIVAYGYWEGAAFDCNGGRISFYITDFAINPVAGYTANVSGGPYTFGATHITTNRANYRSSYMQGTIVGELDLIDIALFNTRTKGCTGDFIVQETSPTTYGDTNTPMLFAVGNEFFGQISEGNNMKCSARNLNGAMSILDWRDGRVSNYNTWDIHVRYNPDDTSNSSAAIRIFGTGVGNKLIVDVERGIGGAGPNRLLQYKGTSGHVGSIEITGRFEGGATQDWILDSTAGGTFDAPLARNFHSNYKNGALTRTGVNIAKYENSTLAVQENTANGSETQSGDGLATTYTIAHGAGFTPTHAIVVASSADAKGINSIKVDGTNITIDYISAGDTPPLGVNNLTWTWTVEERVTYKTDNNGLSIKDGTGSLTSFTIAHGLIHTPILFSVITTSADASENKLSSITSNATNLTLTHLVAPDSGTDNLSYRWEASIYDPNA